jgi:hypothetical protein
VSRFPALGRLAVCSVSVAALVCAAAALSTGAAAGKTIHMTAGQKSVAVVGTLPSGKTTFVVHAVYEPPQNLGVTAQLESGKSLLYSPTGGGTCQTFHGGDKTLTCDYSIVVKTPGKYVIRFGRLAGPALDIHLIVRAR